MSDDDTYEIPLQDQRVFGAGIKRQRVKFVPSTSSTPAVRTPPSQSASDLYLSIVMSKGSADNLSTMATLDTSQPDHIKLPTKQQNTIMISSSEVCDVCRLPLTSTKSAAIADSEETINLPNSKVRPHEASLAHQVCLVHSHPPSHLDRSRKGLSILSAYGWDPDARQGLGAAGEGIKFPIKVKPKDDKMGIGLVLPAESERRKKVKVEKLDAGKVRKMYEKDKKSRERLQEMFYRSENVDRYMRGS